MHVLTHTARHQYIFTYVRILFNLISGRKLKLLFIALLKYRYNFSTEKMQN